MRICMELEEKYSDNEDKKWKSSNEGPETEGKICFVLQFHFCFTQ
uniref:Uncharacterized protein n=1 Tax=Rhizophora mucronata TaxID=61149 RepID=A0A2P2IPI9_RHIMU